MIDAGPYARLVRVPKTFRERGDVSMIALLIEAGFPASGAELSEESILAALRNDPACVEDWLTYSCDKRSEGWFVREHNHGRLEVGTYRQGEGIKVWWTFATKTEACAKFIFTEVGEIIQRPQVRE